MKNNIRVVVMPARSAVGDNLPFYNAAFETWKAVWRETLLELDGLSQLFSDHFTRQDYMVALFHGPVCVGLVCFRRANTGVASNAEDSWFKPWPSHLMQHLTENFQDGIVVSWVTIHPEYRKSTDDPTLKDLNIVDRLAEMMNFFLEDCGTSAGFGVTRNNRSVNRFGAYGGSNVLQNDAVHHGVNVDLITLMAENVKAVQKQYPPIARELWENRLVYEDTLLNVTRPQSVRRLNVA